MTKHALIALTCAALLGASALAATKVSPPKGPMTIALPGDAGMAFKPGPGVGLVMANCLTCHSSAYVSTQPQLTRAQWTAEVAKMKTAYGAPIPDDQMPAIVDYLVANYGKP
jgi:sulfite dehydrogenase